MAPRITCLCPTYKRPVQLANVIACFKAQTYKNKQLLILDDAGQYPNIVAKNWNLVSSQVRFRTLGEKRNATVALTSEKTDLFAVWDDDDAYLPWHLEGLVKALENADYVIPSELYMERMSPHHHIFIQRNPRCLFHGAWGFKRQAFLDVGGYPWRQSGQDQGLLKRFRAHCKVCRNSTENTPPSYIYRWCTIPGHLHISGVDRLRGYEDIMPTINWEHQETLIPKFEQNWLKLARECEDRL